MSEYAAAYEIDFAHETANDAINPLVAAALVEARTLVDNTATLDVAAIDSGLKIPLLAYQPINGVLPIAAVHGFLVAGATTAYMFAIPGITDVVINGVSLANNAADAIQASTVIADGRLAPPINLQIDGAAEAAVRAVGAPGGASQFSIVQAYPPQLEYKGYTQLLAFEDEPPDTLLDGQTKTDSLLVAIKHNGARYFLGTTTAGVDEYLNDCRFAAVSPHGAVWVLPTDIGNNAEQIPSSVLQNSAAHFNFHPSVFIRRSDYVRQVRRVLVDTEALNTGNLGSQPLAIHQINTALVDSDWLIVVDGVMSLVRLAHPAGSDFRRPKDIWNNVWVPLLQGSQSSALPIHFLGGNGLYTGVTVSADRLRYLEYARFIAPGSSFSITTNPQGDTQEL